MALHNRIATFQGCEWTDCVERTNCCEQTLTLMMNDRAGSAEQALVLPRCSQVQFP